MLSRLIDLNLKVKQLYHRIISFSRERELYNWTVLAFDEWRLLLLLLLLLMMTIQRRSCL